MTMKSSVSGAALQIAALAAGVLGCSAAPAADSSIAAINSQVSAGIGLGKLDGFDDKAGLLEAAVRWQGGVGGAANVFAELLGTRAELDGGWLGAKARQVGLRVGKGFTGSSQRYQVTPYAYLGRTHIRYEIEGYGSLRQEATLGGAGLMLQLSLGNAVVYLDPRYLDSLSGAAGSSFSGGLGMDWKFNPHGALKLGYSMDDDNKALTIGFGWLY